MAMKSSSVCALEPEKIAKTKWRLTYGTPCNSNIPMVNYLYLTDWSADCLLDLAITGLGWLLDSIAESATAGVSNSWFQFATELSRSRMFLSTVLMEGFSWTVDTIFNSLLTGLGLLLTTLIAGLYILSKPWASHLESFSLRSPWLHYLQQPPPPHSPPCLGAGARVRAAAAGLGRSWPRARGAMRRQGKIRTFSER